MPYSNSLHNAAQWLVKIQTTTGGWGLNSGQAPSIVNTAEAAYVLCAADRARYYGQLKEAASFIERNCVKHIETNPRVRYAAFGLLLARDLPELFTQNILDVQSWLLSARNADGGWGHEANDQNSLLYPTTICLQVLRDFNTTQLDASYNWIKSRCVVPGRWSFGANTGVSPVATAMAVCALKDFEPLTSPFYALARDHLVGFEAWGVMGENQPGTNWMHSSWMWVIPGLLSFGIAPFEKSIAEGVRQLNMLQSDHGWMEPSPLGHLTVRGQYWAVKTLEAVKAGFDPSVHPYRIDSAIATQEMLEPEFVIIRPHKKWSVAIPGRLYRFVTIATICLSAVFFSGVQRSLPDTPRWLDFLVALALFGCAMFLVKKRRAQFKPVYYIVTGILALVSLLNFVVGYSVWELFENFDALIHK